MGDRFEAACFLLGNRCIWNNLYVRTPPPRIGRQQARTYRAENYDFRHHLGFPESPRRYLQWTEVTLLQRASAIAVSCEALRQMVHTEDTPATTPRPDGLPLDPRAGGFKSLPLHHPKLWRHTLSRRSLGGRCIVTSTWTAPRSRNGLLRGLLYPKSTDMEN